MAEFSDRMAATALRLITSKGEEISLERSPHGGMTASGDRQNTQQPSTVRAVLLPGDGEDIGENSKTSSKVYLAAVNPVPKTGDILVFPSGSLNAGKWQILEAKNYAPEGQIIFSDLKVAR